MDTLPSVPGGNSKRRSWAYCAAFFCISLAPTSSFERWLRCFFLLFCFAASSGVSGAKATRMASTADICLKKLLFMSCPGRGLTASQEGTSCLSLLKSLSGNGTTRFPKRFACYSILLYNTSRVTTFIDGSVHGNRNESRFTADVS
jgi:hypothetical protein